MSRKIFIEFPDIKTKFHATLQEEAEPEQCEALWKVLKNPLKMVCYNTLSTGHFFGADGRPPRHPVKFGSQAKPIGRGKPLLLCQLDPGMIIYAGGHSLKFAYGPDITEPLAAPGPVTAIVDKDGLDDLMKAGLSVWNAQFMTHRVVTMIAGREEV